MACQRGAELHFEISGSAVRELRKCLDGPSPGFEDALRSDWDDRWTRIRHSDVKPITSRPSYVAGYALKGLKYSLAETDGLLILPLSSSAVPPRQRRNRPQRGSQFGGDGSILWNRFLGVRDGLAVSPICTAHPGPSRQLLVFEAQGYPSVVLPGLRLAPCFWFA